MVTGFVIQGAAAFVFFSYLGRTWVRYIGAYFIIMAFAYHGLTEVFGLLFPGRNINRSNLTEQEFENFFLAISGAILLLTISYLLTLQKSSPLEQPTDEERYESLNEVARMFNWKVLLGLTLPLIIWTARGRGLSAAATYGTVQQGASLQANLATYFLILAAPLTAMAFVLRFGRKAVIPALILLSVALGFSGQRNEVVVSVLIFVYLMAMIGLRVSRKLIIGGLLIVTMLGLILTSTRANLGREAFAPNQSATAKLVAAIEGVHDITNQKTGDALALDLGYRLDGNSFGGMELAAIDRGHEPLGLTPVFNNILVAVPSFLSAGKLDAPIETRLEKLYAQKQFGLPIRDILTTQLGSTVGYFGLWSLGIASMLIGVLLAVLDRWLKSSKVITPLRLLIGAGALSAVAHYGEGLASWTVTGRGVLVIAAVLWTWQTITRFQNSPRESQEIVHESLLLQPTRLVSIFRAPS